MNKLIIVGMLLSVIAFSTYAIVDNSKKQTPHNSESNSVYLSSKPFDLHKPGIFVVRLCKQNVLLFAWMKNEMRVASHMELRTNMNNIIKWVATVDEAILKKEGSRFYWRTKLEDIIDINCEEI